MDGPGGPAARHRIRLGDAERERFFALLREHYAAGRLSLDEVRSRTEIVVSGTYADEANAALAELPVIAPTVPAPGDAVSPPQRRGLFARKGHAQAARPDPGWVSTEERFRDPSTNTIMRVWLDPADGSRHYVPDAPAP